MSMLVGGGHRAADSGELLEVQLLVDGTVVRSLAGDDAGQLNWKGWDVSEFAGRTAQLRIVDQATGGWGHLTLDHVMLTDQAAVPRSDETTVNLVVDGQVVRSATGANSEVLDWASWNVAEFKGRQASIKVVDNNRFGWGHILADEFVASPQPATSRLETYDWLDYGRDYYASVSFANMPQDKRIMLGWMNNWDYANSIPTSPWRSAMSLPREVGLTQTAAGPRLTQRAVKQVDSLAAKAGYTEKRVRDIAPGTTPLPAAASGQVQRIDVTFAPGTAAKAGITVLGNGSTSTVIGYDQAAGELYVDRSNSGDTSFHPLFTSVDSAPVTPDASGNVTLRIYVDRSSVEVFAQDGLRTITDQVFPEAGASQVALFADGGTAKLKSITVTPMADSMFGTQGKLVKDRR
jgi:levanase